MAPVLNRPVMEHGMRLLARHGFTETIANLHWFPETIEGHFSDGSEFGLELSYSHEEQLLGTAGGVRNVADFLGDSFLVIAGDALTDIDLAAMRKFHESHDGLATVATKRVRDTREFGVVIADGDGRIQGFQEKPEPAEALSDLANTCIYMFRAEVYDFFPPPGTSKAAGRRRPSRLRRLGDGRLPGPAPERRALLLGRDRRRWNDIRNLEELPQSNFDALGGAVRPRRGRTRVAPGASAPPSPCKDAEVEGPALIGAGVELGSGARIEGPAIVGDDCRVAVSPWVRYLILLAGDPPAGAPILARRHRRPHRR